jgi:hypothetical protein
MHILLRCGQAGEQVDPNCGKEDVQVPLHDPFRVFQKGNGQIHIW